MKEFVWKVFKEDAIKRQPKAPEGASSISALYELGTALTYIFNVSRDDLITQSDYTKKEKEDSDNRRINGVVKLLTNLALIEDFYDLGESRYAGFLGEEAVTGATSLNLLEIYGAGLGLIADISDAMITADIDTIQDKYNRMFEVVLDICLAYSINSDNYLPKGKEDSSRAVIKGTNDSEVLEDPFMKEFKDMKTLTRKQKRTPIIISATMAKGRTGIVRKVTVKGHKGTKTFNSNNLISDYFSASNYLASTYKGEEYLINYDPTMRKILSGSSSTIKISYIYEGKLIDINEALSIDELQVLDNKTITISREARPVIVTHNMETLDDLLDYINRYNKLKKV